MYGQFDVLRQAVRYMSRTHCTVLYCTVLYCTVLTFSITLYFILREHAMVAICNGMFAYGGCRPFCATFLNFIGYALGSVRYVRVCVCVCVCASFPFFFYLFFFNFFFTSPFLLHVFSHLIFLIRKLIQSPFLTLSLSYSISVTITLFLLLLFFFFISSTFSHCGFTEYPR